jgi:hypothetical protein
MPRCQRQRLTAILPDRHSQLRKGAAGFGWSLRCRDGGRTLARDPRQTKALLEAEAAARQRRSQQRVAELAAAARAKGRQPRVRIKPRRCDEAPNPKATANVTDPTAASCTPAGQRAGLHAQAVTTCEQVIVAAELTQQANDLQQLAPMLTATTATLAAAGIP